MGNNDESIKLFADDGTTVQAVNQKSADEYNNIRSEGVTDIISRDVVKTLILPEGKELAEENYVLDFTACESPTIFRREILKSIISTDKENATVAIYLCNKDKFVQIGWGEKYFLSRMLPLIKVNIFQDDIRVFKNVHHGDELQEVKGADLSDYKLKF